MPGEAGTGPVGRGRRGEQVGQGQGGAAGEVPGGVLSSAASERGRVSRDCSLCLGQCPQEPGEWQSQA